jgi:hypothetical protein
MQQTNANLLKMSVNLNEIDHYVAHDPDKDGGKLQHILEECAKM